MSISLIRHTSTFDTTIRLRDDGLQLVDMGCAEKASLSIHSLYRLRRYTLASSRHSFVMLAAGLLVAFSFLYSIVVVARPVTHSQDYGSRAMIAHIPTSAASEECTADGRCDSRVVDRRNFDIHDVGRRSREFVTVRSRQADIEDSPPFTDRHRTHGGISDLPSLESYDGVTDDDSTSESEREQVSIDGQVIVEEDGQVSVEGEPSSDGDTRHISVNDVTVHQHTS
ncbi:hypothetical protein C8Q80DRAFT_1166256 [Daedaleopsis nitida]|nr:hypothetical protein C8Q80DRAFT_1166256 [Daedaleopsis nitida]